QPPRGAATREAAERGGPRSDFPQGRPKGNQPPGGAATREAAERGGTTAAGQSRAHESARAQVAGTATYIDDMPVVRGTLLAAPVCSPVAHGILRKLDASAALALPGVRAVIGAGDIPGDLVLAAFGH